MPHGTPGLSWAREPQHGFDPLHRANLGSEAAVLDREDALTIAVSIVQAGSSLDIVGNRGSGRCGAIEQPGRATVQTRPLPNPERSVS